MNIVLALIQVQEHLSYGYRRTWKPRMKLLIADDSRVVRERLSLLLSQLENIEIIGYAGTVQKAIDLVAELKPDLIILDIKMPGGCGIDVLENIKSNGKGPIVMMLTNYSYPQYQKKCIDAGADYFFDKSAEFELAIDTIRSLASFKEFQPNYTKEV